VDCRPVQWFTDDTELRAVLGLRLVTSATLVAARLVIESARLRAAILVASLLFSAADPLCFQVPKLNRGDAFRLLFC
jgi:hypothetical protein